MKNFPTFTFLFFALLFGPFFNLSGEDILVNTATEGNQNEPDVTVSNDGNVVVVWVNHGPGSDRPSTADQASVRSEQHSQSWQDLSIVTIQRFGLLQQLFGEIYIAQAVYDEAVVAGREAGGAKRPEPPNPRFGQSRASRGTIE